jgi:hypothetical protein
MADHPRGLDLSREQALLVVCSTQVNPAQRAACSPRVQRVPRAGGSVRSAPQAGARPLEAMLELRYSVSKHS